MTKQKTAHRPVSHEPLRALLEIVEKALDLRDDRLLNNISVLGDYVEPDNPDVHAYLWGEYERLAYDRDEYATMYSDKDIKEVKKYLEKEAYGNFDEAMWALERDLLHVPFQKELESNVFRPEFFNKEDRRMWESLRQVLISQPHTNHDAWAKEAEDAYKSLRVYQQKSYGALLPIMMATYRREAVGFSVRLAWIDNALDVALQTPFYKELSEYLVHTNPIKSVTDFTQDCLPQHIGRYTREAVEYDSLFRYEL